MESWDTAQLQLDQREVAPPPAGWGGTGHAPHIEANEPWNRMSSSETKPTSVSCSRIKGTEGAASVIRVGLHSRSPGQQPQRTPAALGCWLRACTSSPPPAMRSGASAPIHVFTSITKALVAAARPLRL